MALLSRSQTAEACNVLKCDDWPGEPLDDHSKPAYPDPAKCDYNELFALDNRTFEVASKVVAGQYVAERLMLNRGQLILQRRLHVCLLRLARFEAWCKALPEGVASDDLREAVQVIAAISSMKQQVINARPYADKDTKRPSTKKTATRAKSVGKGEQTIGATCRVGTGASAEPV